MWNRRPDGTLVQDAPPYRRLMPLIMPSRTESAVYFEQEVDLERAEAFLADHAASHPDDRATLFHLVVWAAARTLHARPHLNRFVAGGRLWQRDGVWVSYVAKKSMHDEAPVVTLKRRLEPAPPFPDLVAALRAEQREERAPEVSRGERALRRFLRLPMVLLRRLLRLSRWLDWYGLLPRRTIEDDPLYTSLFVANLGSLQMDAAYHHLYEHGNCPIFCVIGRVREVPAVVDGALVVRRRAVLRWTLDERVADGFYAQRALENLRELVEDPGSAAAGAEA